MDSGRKVRTNADATRENTPVLRTLANPYGDGASKAGDAAANGTEQMDPAWLAYYQSMNYYNMMQSNTTGGAPTSTNTSQATDSTANATTAAAGQADYSQQWIEYYRSLGQNDVADEIVRQMKEVLLIPSRHGDGAREPFLLLMLDREIHERVWHECSHCDDDVGRQSLGCLRSTMDQRIRSSRSNCQQWSGRVHRIVVVVTR